MGDLTKEDIYCDIIEPQRESLPSAVSKE